MLRFVSAAPAHGHAQTQCSLSLPRLPPPRDSQPINSLIRVERAGLRVFAVGALKTEATLGIAALIFVRLRQTRCLGPGKRQSCFQRKAGTSNLNSICAGPQIKADVFAVRLVHPAFRLHLLWSKLSHLAQSQRATEKQLLAIGKAVMQGRWGLEGGQDGGVGKGLRWSLPAVSTGLCPKRCNFSNQCWLKVISVYRLPC